VTGTPCVGKTSVARLLASKLEALYVNLTELATQKKLTLGRDQKRNTVIIDEKAMRKKLGALLKEHDRDSVVDGHYAASVVPEKLVTRVFVLRRDPVELKKFMEKAGFSGPKLWENLASEILDVCLVDALNVHEEAKICELDVSGRTAEETVTEILDVLISSKKCHVGVVDWLGKLENEGLLDEFLKI
jgi:adenylate kinase